jgi:hypothetical protein
MAYEGAESSYPNPIPYQQRKKSIMLLLLLRQMPSLILALIVFLMYMIILLAYKAGTMFLTLRLRYLITRIHMRLKRRPLERRTKV